MGGLVIIDPVVVALLVVLTVSCWFGCLLLRRRGLRAPARVGAAAALLLTLATTGDVVNTHFAYLPRLADVLGVPTWPTVQAAELRPAPAGRSATDHPARRRDHRGGGVISLTLPGQRSGFGGHRALIYLPPEYFTQPGRRFPVVYLLHGSPGAPVDWFRADRASDVGLAAARDGNPLILVAPAMSQRWSDDSECVDRPREHVEQYLIGDVVPQVDRVLRTVPERGARAVAGNSAGGYCALNLGLRHREVFSTIIDLSGYTAPTFDAGLPALFGPRPDLRQQVAANTPAEYAGRLAAEPRVRLWLDSGAGDRRPRRDLSSLAPVLRGRGQQVTLHLRPGAHEHNVWRPALRQSVLWAAPALTRAAAAAGVEHTGQKRPQQS